MFLGFLDEIDWGLGVGRRVCGGGGVEGVCGAAAAAVVVARLGLDLCLFIIGSVLLSDCIANWLIGFGNFARVR